MAGSKIKAKIKAVLKPAAKGGKPIRPEGGDAGLLSEKIVSVVRQKKEKKDEPKKKKD